MLGNLRVNIVRRLIELNEKYIFDRRLLKYYRSVFKGQRMQCFVDIGANLGQTIEIALQINPQCDIYSFEPNPELFKKLKEKYAGHKNVHLFQMGVSNESGKKMFHENVFHATSSFEDLDMSSKYLKKKADVLGVTPETIVKKSYEVNITTLADFISTHIPDKRIDVLKIDTEGHEYACLLGLFNGKNHDIRFFQIESHNDDMYANKIPFSKISSLLNEHNFSLKARIKHGFGEFDEVIFEKAIS